MADVVKLVLSHYDLERPAFLGYDSGASTGLKMALKWPKLFSKVVAFHPSYTEETKDELKNLKTPVLLNWVKQD